MISVPRCFYHLPYLGLSWHYTAAYHSLLLARNQIHVLHLRAQSSSLLWQFFNLACHLVWPWVDVGLLWHKDHFFLIRKCLSVPGFALNQDILVGCDCILLCNSSRTGDYFGSLLHTFYHFPLQISLWAQWILPEPFVGSVYQISVGYCWAWAIENLQSVAYFSLIYFKPIVMYPWDISGHPLLLLPPRLCS
jgi:hypothetical protein